MAPSPYVKLVIFVPVPHADAIRHVLAKSGTGAMGKYDSCSFSSFGIGRFRPLKGSHPAIGTEGKVEEAEEERIEVLCPRSSLQKVLHAVREVHPYEEPAIDVYPLEAV